MSWKKNHRGCHFYLNMGNCCSIRFPQENDFYANLHVPKANPIDIVPIDSKSDSDIPLFAPAAEVDDNDVISDPETLTDAEINAYASKLSDSDE